MAPQQCLGYVSIGCEIPISYCILLSSSCASCLVALEYPEMLSGVVDRRGASSGYVTVSTSKLDVVSGAELRR